MELFPQIAIPLAVAFIIFIVTYRFNKPRLSMEVLSAGNSSTHEGVAIAIKNKEEDDFYDFRKSVRQYRFSWTMKLIIRNSGNLDANSIELFFHDKSPILNFIPRINKLVPILKNGELILKAEYQLRERKVAKDKSQASDIRATVFKDLKMILKYKDKFGIVNYSQFDFVKKRNRYRTFFRFRKYRSKGLGTIPEGFM